MDAGKISQKDFNRLMAYMDGSLSKKDRVRFENKLETSVELKQALLQQKRLKAALRSLPVKNAPRDYMLTPDMVKIHNKVSPMFPVFRFASAAAAIMLMLVFAGQYLLGPQLFMARQPAPNQEMMLAEAPDMEYSKEAPVETPLILWGDQSASSYGVGGALGMGGAVGMGGGIDPLSPEEAAKLAGEEQTVEALEMPVMQESEPEAESQIFTMEEPAAEAPEMLAARPDSASAVPLILGVNEEEGGEVVAQSSPSELLIQTEHKLSTLNWIEIALGFLALGTGVVAFILRRKS